MAVMTKRVNVAFVVPSDQKERFLSDKHNNASQAIARAQRCAGVSFKKKPVGRCTERC